MIWRPARRAGYDCGKSGISRKQTSASNRCGHWGAIMRQTFAALAVLLFTLTAALADPAGFYLVNGTDAANGNPYSGTVRVERTGDTFRVTWLVGNTQYDGTGIGNAEFLAVSYRAGNITGLALYGTKGDNWEGIWAYAGGRRLGTEVWQRR